MKFKQNDMRVNWGDQLQFFYLEKKKLQLPPHAHKKETALDQWPTTNWSSFNSTAYGAQATSHKNEFLFGGHIKRGRGRPFKKMVFFYYLSIFAFPQKNRHYPSKIGWLGVPQNFCKSRGFLWGKWSAGCGLTYGQPRFIFPLKNP